MPFLRLATKIEKEYNYTGNKSRSERRTITNANRSIDQLRIGAGGGRDRLSAWAHSARKPQGASADHVRPVLDRHRHQFHHQGLSDDAGGAGAARRLHHRSSAAS